MTAVAIPSAWSRSRTPNWLPTSTYNAGAGVYFANVTQAANDVSVAITQDNSNDQFRVILNPFPITPGTHTITGFHAEVYGLTADSCKAAKFAVWKLIGSTYTPVTPFRSASERTADATSYVEMTATGLTDSVTVAAGETFYIGLAVHLEATYTAATKRVKDGSVSSSLARHWTFTVADENHALSAGLSGGTTGVEWIMYATFATSNRVLTTLTSPSSGSTYPSCWFAETWETNSIEQVVVTAGNYLSVGGVSRLASNASLYQTWMARLDFVAGGAYFVRSQCATAETTDKILADEEAGCHFHLLVQRIKAPIYRHAVFYCNQNRGQGGAYPGVNATYCPDVDSNITWLCTNSTRNSTNWTSASSTMLHAHCITIVGTGTIGTIKVGIEPVIWLGDSQFANTPSASTAHAFNRIGGTLVSNDPLRIHVNAAVGGGMWTEKSQTVSSPIWYRYIHPTTGAGELCMLVGPALLVLGAFSNDINNAGATVYPTYNRAVSFGGWLQGLGKIISMCHAGDPYATQANGHKIWVIGGPPENSYTAMEANQMIAMNEILHQIAFGLDGKSSDLFYATVDTATMLDAVPQFRTDVSSDGTHADGDLAAISASLINERDYTTIFKMHVTDYWPVENSLPSVSLVVDGTNRGDGELGTYPTTATSKAEQLADDQAEVTANKDAIQIGTTILGVAGELPASSGGFGGMGISI